MHLWQRFDMLNIGMLIFVEDHTRVHDVLWVKELLHFFHQLIRCITPLATNEWRHVATCTVLRFQTTVVFVHHQVHYCTHHTIVLCNGLWRVKALIQDKVIIALQGVTVNHGLWVIMFNEELLQIQCGLRQVLNRESNVLNQACGANLACTAHGWEDTATHCPILARQYRV